MAFKIERNVIIPPLPQGRKAKYPWDDLAVCKKDRNGEPVSGDCFFIPGGKASVVSSANKRYKKEDIKFTARQLKKDGIDGIGAWRIE
jgi:hypothetical protein